MRGRKPAFGRRYRRAARRSWLERALARRCRPAARRSPRERALARQRRRWVERCGPGWRLAPPWGPRRGREWTSGRETPSQQSSWAGRSEDERTRRFLVLQPPARLAVGL